ncbi:MAG TPA: aquaporin [Blastocatellia bacterium]|nr:aquaporin [Blastocatellia bacterium]
MTRAASEAEIVKAEPVKVAASPRVAEDSVLTASLPAQCIAEYLGTFIILLLGDGAVAVAVLSGGIDNWGVAVVWGLGVTFAIYVAAPVSGAHFNPAVTITMAVFRGFPPGRILPFIASQVAGAFTAAACVYMMWLGFWAPAAAKLGVEIGGPGSQKLMMVFSAFYPNPGGVGVDDAAMATISTGGAFFVEALLTGMLLLMVFALTEPRSAALPQAGLGPVFIGLTVTATVVLGGGLTMDAINPARDFGPRLFGYVIGFGDIAFPGPRGNEWWLYILGPVTGGLAGAAVYTFLVRRYLPKSAI